MNQTVQAITAQKQSRNAIARVEALEAALEKTLPEIIKSVNEGFDHFQKDFSKFDELIEALVLLAGPENISLKVAEVRQRKADERAALQKTQIEGAVASGDLTKQDVISEGSLIVFEEGEKKNRSQYNYSQLLPDIKEKLLGKGVGTSFTSENNVSFSVVEIYNMTPKAPDVTATATEAT